MSEQEKGRAVKPKPLPACAEQPCSFDKVWTACADGRIRCQEHTAEFKARYPNARPLPPCGVPMCPEHAEDLEALGQTPVEGGCPIFVRKPVVNYGAPWRVAPDGEGEWLVIDRYGCSVLRCKARGIAEFVVAAPELYSALRGLLDAALFEAQQGDGISEEMFPHVAASRVAIRKAETGR